GGDHSLAVGQESDESDVSPVAPVERAHADECAGRQRIAGEVLAGWLLRVGLAIGRTKPPDSHDEPETRSHPGGRHGDLSPKHDVPSQGAAPSLSHSRTQISDDLSERS